ncbi:hypothetical protein D3C84_862260 [compost metagenome]
MDLVEYCKHAIVVEKPPIGVILVLHGLISNCGSNGTDKSIQAPPQDRRERSAKSVDDLARGSKTQHEIDLALL